MATEKIKTVRCHTDEWLKGFEDKSSHASGHDKTTVYKWTKTQDEGRMQRVAKNMLLIDTQYQRDINNHRVNNIANDFSWTRFGVITVFERNGRFVVADGQHRVAAAMKRAEILDVPCLIFSSKGKAQEAMAFIEINTSSKVVSSMAKYKAGVVAQDPLYLSVKRVFEKSGLTVCDNAHQPGKNVRCVQTFVKIVRDMGEPVAIEIANAASCANPQGFVNERIVIALAYIHKQTGGIPSDMVADIKRVESAAIMRAISTKISLVNFSGERVFASGLIDAINKGKRNKKWRGFV
jgi:hypothetical protein